MFGRKLCVSYFEISENNYTLQFLPKNLAISIVTKG